jgi:hypothetical protein
MIIILIFKMIFIPRSRTWLLPDCRKTLLQLYEAALPGRRRRWRPTTVWPAMIYDLALPFNVERGLAPGQAVGCPSGPPPRSDARKPCQAMKPMPGAVAFSRSGNLNPGEFEDAAILKIFGLGAGAFRNARQRMAWRIGWRRQPYMSKGCAFPRPDRVAQMLGAED